RDRDRLVDPFARRYTRLGLGRGREAVDHDVLHDLAVGEREGHGRIEGFELVHFSRAAASAAVSRRKRAGGRGASTYNTPGRPWTWTGVTVTVLVPLVHVPRVLDVPNRWSAVCESRSRNCAASTLLSQTETHTMAVPPGSSST